MKNKIINKLVIFIVMLSVCANAWEVNTHRLIDRKASDTALNLGNFIEDSQVGNEAFDDSYLKYLGYRTTYFNYITYTKKKSGIVYNPAMSELDFEFEKHDYKNLIEAGSILEDATWPVATFWGGNGRFFNHFYNPQDDNSGFILGLNALSWAEGVVINLYSYSKAKDYMRQAFASSTEIERKTNLAKMFVSIGHVMHLFNDMNVPAHTRGDAHNPDSLELWMRGGKNHDGSTGFYVSGNAQAGVLKGLTADPNTFTDFKTNFVSEAKRTSTEFLSEDTKE